jgi:NifU-like protein involved in Fe-S cluster formation
VRLFLHVGADHRIARARFQAFGCPIAIAAASAAGARIEGARVSDALALRADELARELALALEQARLAELPLRALRDALAYLRPRP